MEPLAVKKKGQDIKFMSLKGKKFLFCPPHVRKKKGTQLTMRKNIKNKESSPYINCFILPRVLQIACVHNFLPWFSSAVCYFFCRSCWPRCAIYEDAFLFSWLFILVLGPRIQTTFEKSHPSI